MLMRVANCEYRLVFEAEFLLGLVESVVPARLNWLIWPLRVLAKKRRDSSTVLGQMNTGGGVGVKSKEEQKERKDK